MKLVKLKSVTDVITGFPFKSKFYGDHGIRTVRGENITEGKLRWDSIKCWKGPFEKKEFYSLKANDIVIGMDGSKVGKNKARIFETDLPLLLAQRVACIRSKENLDQVFLYYCINNFRFEDYVFRIQTGSSVPHISKTQIEEFQIPYTDLTSQKQIAKVLSDLDAKIEVNNKINQELETMAKTLYDYWFVQFDFPDANGKPYKSSGGNMVFNEELKREIPEGWEVKMLSDFADCNKWNRTKESLFDKINYLDTSSLTENVIEYLQKLDFERDKIPSRAQRIVSKNDILYSTVRPNQLHYGIIKRPIENLIASTGFAQIRGNDSKIKNDFIFQILSQDYVSIRLQQIAVGSVSAYPSISHNDIMELKVTLPLEDKLIKKATDIFQQCNDKIALNLEENQKLAELRDWLLPMLMNGQVRVAHSHADGNLSEVEQGLGMVAEPGAAYEKDKGSIDSLFDAINYDYEVAVVVLLTRQRLERTYGKKYIHKMFSNIKFLESLPVFEDLQFQENHWGMYCPTLTKTIDNQKFIYFEGVNDEVSVINFKYKHIKEVSDWMKQDDYNKNFVNQVNNMLSIYEKPLINKNMDRIELLNTVLECMSVLETDNFDAIWNKMERWKMQEDNYKTKAEKFKPEETRMMIDFIKGLK